MREVHCVELHASALRESQGGSVKLRCCEHDATAVDAFSKITRWYMVNPDPSPTFLIRKRG